MRIYFSGGEVRNRTLPLNIVKGLIDEVYNSLWRIFSDAIQKAAPNVAEQTLRKGLRIPTHEPAFASLLITFEKPQVDFSDFLNKPDVDVKQANENIEAAHNSFLQSAAEIADAIENGRLTTELANQNIEAIEALANLIPSQRSFFETVQIQGHSASKKDARKLIINAASGQVIKEAYQLAMQGERRIKGTVVAVSARSFSFIVRSSGFKETTCIGLTDPVREFIAALANGTEIWVRGPITLRKRRDQLKIAAISLDGNDWLT